MTTQQTFPERRLMRSFLAAVLGACFWPGVLLAQETGSENLSRRLAELEEKLARMESENEQLRQRVANLEGSGSGVGEIASGASLLVASRQGTAGAPAVPASAPQRAASTEATPQRVAPTEATPQRVASTEAAPQRVSWGAEIRLRPETRSDFNDAIALNNFLLQRIRLQANLRFADNVSGVVQFQDSRLWGQEASTGSNESNVDLHQAYLQVDRFLNPRASLRLGRQEMIYGNERLVGAFGWDNVGRAFDGMKLTYAAPQWSSDFFFSRLNDRRNSGRGDGSQDLIGWYTKIGKSGARTGLEPYVLYLRDGLATRGELNAAQAEPTRIATLGFRHFAESARGLGYVLENAYQVGQNGPDTHRAAALAAVGRYRAPRRFSPEFGFEYDYATGDADARDGRSGEFNNLFPTNHPLYGYADYLGWRNLQDFKPYFAFVPAANTRAEISYHRFLLVESRGPWKSAGGKVLGFDPTGELGTDLGHEVDVTWAFPLYERVRVLAGYSIFLPGRFARGTQGPQAVSFGYLQTLVTF